MAHGLRPVGLDFTETAPLRLVFAAHAAAAPEEVYRALAAEVEAWPQWFRAVSWARPVEREGRAGREVLLRGGGRFLETVIAAEPVTRYAYRTDETNTPGLRALLEDWLLIPTGSGTIVRWTVAVDAPAPVRLALGLARPGLGHAFRGAVRSLDRRLAEARRRAG
ncbi:SRPBCC family protein [Streptomyces netropsis]|uniref:SRPBCC family protein n=1 Tax=Streptomyces netropsis TaxID=55404 RepID=UPI0037A9A7BE